MLSSTLNVLRLWRHTFIAVVLGAVFLTVVGTLSSCSSSLACRRDTRLFLNTYFPGLEKTVQIRWLDQAQVHDELANVHVPRASRPWGWSHMSLLMRPRNYMANNNLPPPWAYIRADCMFPFLVRVDYTCYAAPLAGRGGVRIYATMFGAKLLLGDWPTWFS